MKQSRLVFTTATTAAVCAWAFVAFACPDHDTKASSASAKGKSVHVMASASGQCTPEMAAACKAGGTSATTASMSGSCAAHGVKASAAGAGGSCSAHGTSTSSMSATSAGSSCGPHNSSAKMMSKAADCDACADMAMCADDARDMGASVSIVPLKNGVMFVYTADQAAKVQAVQAEMSRRSDHVNAVLAAGDKAKLCPDCKLMRGAMASGKLSREMVNIEGGCLTLLTSTDASVIAKLHTMAGTKGQSRLVKS